jgi:hypothetical protein
MAALGPAQPPDSGEPRSAAPLDSVITLLPGDQRRRARYLIFRHNDPLGGLQFPRLSLGGLLI